MECQLQYIDRQLDKVQELMKELQFVPEITPKGKSIKKNQILSQTQLWVDQQADKIDHMPIIQVSSVRDINHTSPRMFSSKPKWMKARNITRANFQ